MKLQNISSEQLKSISSKIDLAWNAHLEKQCHDEAEKYFGKNYWGLTISECSEPEFKIWWEKNKELPYDSYYYEVAQYVWDKYSEYITP